MKLQPLIRLCVIAGGLILMGAGSAQVPSGQDGQVEQPNRATGLIDQDKYSVFGVPLLPVHLLQGVEFGFQANELPARRGYFWKNEEFYHLYLRALYEGTRARPHDLGVDFYVRFPRQPARERTDTYKVFKGEGTVMISGIGRIAETFDSKVVIGIVQESEDWVQLSGRLTELQYDDSTSIEVPSMVVFEYLEAHAVNDFSEIKDKMPEPFQVVVEKFVESLKISETNY